MTLFEKCTFKLADGSLATNETLKERAIHTGKMPADKVWVVRSFPDIGRFKRTEPDESAKRGRRYLAGYVGIMAEQDGVEYLVKAMDHIVNVQGRDDIGCVIIGDGPDYDRLREMSAELKLTDHIEFTGYMSGAPLLQKLSACDIGVIPDPPNVCNDKLSMNKVFEYMALGMPFVQFDLEQAKIDAGDAAHIVPECSPESLGQGMMDLLADPERRAKMAAYASDRAQREFHWDIEKHSMLDAYRTLLHTKEAPKISESVSVSQ
ncbi:MAG: glycosyltransferase [Roseibium album]|uniref:glycosyltransferase n=1 Tax=Roseibium album TaxID=311410 RepID=UPI0032EAA79F